MKKNHTFGVSTIILTFTLLCVTALCALTLLAAYADYNSVVEHGAQIQAFYQNP